MKLDEKKRSELISKSINADKTKSYGTTRYVRKDHVHVFNTVKAFNRIDMNALWKADLLSFKVPIHGETSNYEVEILFDGILDAIKQEIKANQNKVEYKCIYRAIIKAINNQDIYIGCTCPDYCLKGDTEIKLLNGEVHTIDELKTMFEKGVDMWCYSVDDKGDFKPGHISDVWISGYANDMVKITLDNGKEIITTPNHRYMTRAGEYVQAKDLTINQSLMPLYFSYTENGYENVKLNSRDTTSFVSVYKYNHKVVNIEDIHYDEAIPVYDMTVDKYNNFFVNDGVMLHNCFRFQYWGTKERYNSMKTQLVPAKFTNPNNSKGAGCKHIMNVLANLDWALKLASTINNYIIYMQENEEDKFARIMFPAIYDMSYDKAVQMGLFGEEESDDLANTMDNEEDVEVIDQANAEEEDEIPVDDIEEPEEEVIEEPEEEEIA